MQRARNRRCRHSERIDVFFEQFEFLFMFHAETLFFVENQKSQILKLYVACEKSVRTDYEIDVAA